MLVLLVLLTYKAKGAGGVSCGFARKIAYPVTDAASTSGAFQLSLTSPVSRVAVRSLGGELRVGLRLRRVIHRHGDGLHDRQLAAARAARRGDGHKVHTLLPASSAGSVLAHVRGHLVIGCGHEAQHAGRLVNLELPAVGAAGDRIPHRVAGVVIGGLHRANEGLVLVHREDGGALERRWGVGLRHVVGDGIVV